MAQGQADDWRAQRGFIMRTVYDTIDKLLMPVRLATSKFALKAYLTSILFFLTAVVLFTLAVLAYILFYWSYIPRIGFSRPIHLQYDPIPIDCRAYLATTFSPAPQSVLNLLANENPLDPALSSLCAGTPAPYGSAPITPELIGQQAYDVVVELTMPLSPTNLEAGNFMIDAALLSTPSGQSNPYAPPPISSGQDVILAHSRRPALLPYHSPLLRLYATLFALPRATLGLPTERTTLSIPVFERVSFPRGSRIPSEVRVSLQAPSGAQLRVYAASVHFRARFTGLRWAMYNFRFVSAGVFIGVFFAVEVIGAAVVYAVLGVWLFSSSGERRVKDEPRRERIDNGPGVPGGFKAEDDDEVEPKIKLEDLGPMTPGVGGEADDEDDEDVDYILNEAGGWRDSGMGTSLESGGLERASVRRRRSRGANGGGGMVLDNNKRGGQ